jgi:uncharacterized membrane protein
MLAVLRDARRRAPWLIIPLLFLLMAFHAASNPLLLAGDRLLDIADYAGYAVCHRLTGHSFLLAGRQMPLCARCTGMYLGVALVAAVSLASGRHRRTGMPPWPVLGLLLLFLVAMGVDGLNSYAHFFPGAPHLYTPRNWLRLITGMGTGLGMGVMALPALAETLWETPDRRAVLFSLREMSGLLGLAALLVGLVLSNQGSILYVLSVVSAVGVLFILSVINTIGLLALTRREGRVRRNREALWPLLGGMSLALTQIAVISVLRYSLTGTMAGFPGL